MATIAPFSIGVCSWSMQVKNIPELSSFLVQLGVNLVQIACGDPHHASWDEGDELPKVATEAELQMSGAMLGFPGEDYTTPDHIKRTGGFGDPATRPERLEILEWGLQRTKALGLSDIMFHGGFIPEAGSPERKSFLDTMAKVADMAAAHGVTIALETGQETADLLRLTLDELRCPNLKVNFDPANMLLYDMGDPLRAVEILGPDIRSVHAKDANRPKEKGQWGQELPLGQGQVNIPEWVNTLKKVGYSGPLVIEREWGTQEERLRDIAAGIEVLKGCVG